MSYFVMKAVTLIVLLALTVCVVPASEELSLKSGDERPRVILRGGKQRLLLPGRLEKLLHTHLSLKDYDLPVHLMKGRWSQFSAATAVPYATWGDFNGDGLTDVALLFSQSGPPHKAYWWYVYVFYQEAGGVFSRNTTFRLDEFGHSPVDPNPIQSYALAVHPAGAPIQSGGFTLPYTYPLDSVALVRLDQEGEAIERIYAWDRKLGVIRRTILDALGKEAAIQPPAPEHPKVQGSGAERTVVLPWGLRAFLASEFAGLRLPGPAEMRKGEWARFENDEKVPWASWGDYNGDGITDLALILVDETGGAKRWSVMAFLQTDNQSFESYELERFHERADDPSRPQLGEILPAPPPQSYYVRTVPPGHKDFWLDSLPDRFDSIVLTYLPVRPVAEIRSGYAFEWIPNGKWFFDVRFGGMVD